MITKLLDKVLTSQKALRFDPMWFLEPSAAPAGDAGVWRALESLRTNGFAVLEGNVKPEVCDQVTADFVTHCEGAPEASRYRDAHGLYERLASLHLRSEAARSIAFESRATAVIEAAFRSVFTVVGSLYFDKGSTQSIHRDTPAFFTNPLNHYLGVWTALEDVRPGSGPLMYFPRGHTVVPDRTLLEDPSVNARNYNARVQKACEQAGLELVEFLPRRGDTLLWHPELPHGGAPIKDPTLSRRSLVFHCIPTGAPIHGPPVFFGERGRVATQRNYGTIKFGRFEAIDQGEPRFFHNRYEGNFDEF